MLVFAEVIIDPSRRKKSKSSNLVMRVARHLSSLHLSAFRVGLEARLASSGALGLYLNMHPCGIEVVHHPSPCGARHMLRPLFLEGLNASRSAVKSCLRTRGNVPLRTQIVVSHRNMPWLFSTRNIPATVLSDRDAV